MNKAMNTAVFMVAATAFSLAMMVVVILVSIVLVGWLTQMGLAQGVASVLLVDTDKLTLAVGAQQYLYEQNYLWGDFAAAAVLSGLPITVIFLYCQKWIVGGLTAGGVKG